MVGLGVTCPTHTTVVPLAVHVATTIAPTEKWDWADPGWASDAAKKGKMSMSSAGRMGRPGRLTRRT